jgi:hypothetical protein
MSDPTDTPLPREGGGSRQGDPDERPEHVCLHPELIDYVRQQRKSRLPIALALVSLVGGSILTLALLLVNQGRTSGATQVRLEQVEQRQVESRQELDRRSEALDESQEAARARDERILQTLYQIDGRLGRLEERLAVQPTAPRR